MIIYRVMSSGENSVVPKPDPKTVLRVIHNAGFFSCFTIRLMDILNYFNEYHELPDEVDSREQFVHYKSHPGEDLQYFFWNPQTDIPIPYEMPIEFRNDCMAIQFASYTELNYAHLGPFLARYFMPSSEVGDRQYNLITKHDLDFEKQEFCGVFYRGNDKVTEFDYIPYERFLERARMIREGNPTIRFILLPDERQFQDAFLREFPDTITFDEVGAMAKNPKSAVFYETPRDKRKFREAYYFAAILIMARCQHLITHSGNGALWAALYRGHTNNIHQYFNGSWI